MTSKHLFVTAALFTLLLSVVWIVFPESLFAAWGIQSTVPLLFMARRYAVLFLGNAVILWLGREEAQTTMGRAITCGCFVITTLMAGMSLFGILRGVINNSGWIAFGLEALLASGFGYFLFRKRSKQ